MDVLFSEGKSHTAYPIKLVYVETPVQLIYPAQAMFVAPKRSFKHAHDRNTLKRRMREIYRLNKAGFYEVLNATNKKMVLAFIYTGKKIEDYGVMESAMLKLLNRQTKPAK